MFGVLFHADVTSSSAHYAGFLGLVYLRVTVAEPVRSLNMVSSGYAVASPSPVV